MNTATLNTSTLRPGLLVSLKTTISGNVSYEKVDIEERTEDTGAHKAKWETVRTISDPVEYEAAGKVRSKAGALVRAVCAVSAFGLLCPENEAEALEKALNEARKLIADFNSTAKLTRLGFYVITGRIAPDDVEAVKAINSEVRELLQTMQDGVKNLDPKAIRDAAAKARGLGAMLTPDAQVRIQLAIDTARKAARKIVAAGEQAAVEVDQSAIRKIKEQRTAFLDLDGGSEIVAPTVNARALDLAPTPAPAPIPASQRVRLLELDAVEG